jgi:pimeloyl-ACP methyl ester carboxylesterase
MATTWTIHHDGVTIPVSRGGHGRPLVLCPGLNATQVDLHELIELLRRDYDVVTLELRGHGLASAADRYSFEAFLSDLDAVMTDIDLAERPVLVGYSLGADLAVHYASAHPGAVGELVLIDGAIPVPEPFLTEARLPMFRAIWQQLAEQQESLRGTARQVLLTAQEILEVNIEVDEVRSRILDRYRMIDRPVTLITSTAMAGDSDEGRALNENWQAGVERLVRDQPRLTSYRLEGDHGLVFTHGRQIAGIIRAAATP